jgi:hypothetical protein
MRIKPIQPVWRVWETVYNWKTGGYLIKEKDVPKGKKKVNKKSLDITDKNMIDLENDGSSRTK